MNPRSFYGKSFLLMCDIRYGIAIFVIVFKEDVAMLEKLPAAYDGGGSHG